MVRRSKSRSRKIKRSKSRKGGSSSQRTSSTRKTSKARRFASQHKKKIAAGAGVLAALGLGYRHRNAIKSYFDKKKPATTSTHKLPSSSALADYYRQRSSYADF